jgi:4-diphosphocytidyl-2-C-methyl-D-erythritol kinase
LLTFANAKINLGLRITGKRPDGFHNLESVFYPVRGLTDVAEAIPANTFSFRSEGIPVPMNGKSDNNLCVKAYHLLRKDFGLSPVNMFLLKNIPIGAGLGGGSSDAAHVLKMLDELFELKLTHPQLEDYAAQLGSDCPFFIENQPAYVTGRGELLEPFPLNLAGYHITIVYPGVHISTKEAFSHINPAPSEMSVHEIAQLPVIRWKNLLINDFEPWAFEQYPVLSEIKEDLYKGGALYASLSGTGSALFGLAKEKIDFVAKDEGWIVWEGVL